MLYLEDFLELIEQLPSELRDRFTEMREKDLQVQNALDKADQSVKMFFDNAMHLPPEELKRQAAKIRTQYNRILEDADEKVNIAKAMHDLVERFLRKLDTELGKFKIELEADSPGITELLEKRVIEAEEASNKTRREKRKRASKALKLTSASTGQTQQQVQQTSPAAKIPKLDQSRFDIQSPSTSAYAPHSTEAAIMMHLSSAMEQSSNPSSAFLHSFDGSTRSPRGGRPRKLTTRVADVFKDKVHRQEMRQQQHHLTTPHSTLLHSPTAAMDSPASSSISTSPLVSSMPPPQRRPSSTTQSEDGSTDQNDEPRYCICNQVSYGEMVACDNRDCPFEWFHYACVGISQPPKGKWFCPQCTAAARRRQRGLPQPAASVPPVIPRNPNL